MVSILGGLVAQCSTSDDQKRCTEKRGDQGYEIENVSQIYYAPPNVVKMGNWTEYLQQIGHVGRHCDGNNFQAHNH